MSKLKQYIKDTALAQTTHKQTTGKARDAQWLDTRLDKRQILRAALLLYAFSRGVPYTKLEQKAHTKPPVWLSSKLSLDLLDAPVEKGALESWTTVAT